METPTELCFTNAKTRTEEQSGRRSRLRILHESNQEAVKDDAGQKVGLKLSTT